MSLTGDPEPFEPFEVLSSERVYDSHWCGLRRDVLRLPGGGEQEYHVFEVAPAVAVVPVLPDGSIVMLWQYRYPHGRSHWEIPAGRVDAGEAPDVAARRELLEETGYEAETLEELAGFYPVNGISAHHARLFVARGCREVSEPEPGPAERFQVHVMPVQEARSRLRAGDFQDGFTALGLFYYLMARAD
jgi:8-oxo-dGTP pyrophosphatase MutT (NUDIX family)